MDGFKNTTKTQYSTTAGRTFARGGMTVSRNDMAGGEGPMSKPAMVAKYAKGGSVKKGEQKIGRVMEEFTKGKLHSGSKDGPKVKSTKQAVAIALNEARAAGAKIPRVKKAYGGYMDGGSPEAADVLMSRMTKDELAQGAKGVKMAQERLERKSVKRGVPPSSDKPMISQRMKDVGKSIGVVKKAAGGLTLGNKTVNLPSTGSSLPQPVKLPSNLAPHSERVTLGNKTMVDTGAGMRASTGPVTLGNRTMAAPGRQLGNAPMIKLGKKNGGVVKKAAGGLTLGSGGLKAGQSVTNSKPTLGTNRMVDTGNGMRASSGPITLGNRTMAAPSARGVPYSDGPIRRQLPRVGMKNGGLSAMPKGKGCK